MSTAISASGLSSEKIAQLVEAYMESWRKSSGDEIAALFADDALVENPVGGDMYRGKAAIRDAYKSALEGHDAGVELVSLHVAGGEAAAHMHVALDGQRIDVVDVMTFDEDGKFKSLRVYWGPENLL